MSDNLARDYRAEALHVRRLAERMAVPEERRILLNIADRYEQLALHACLRAGAPPG